MAEVEFEFDVGDSVVEAVAVAENMKWTEDMTVVGVVKRSVSHLESPGKQRKRSEKDISTLLSACLPVESDSVLASFPVHSQQSASQYSTTIIRVGN